MKLKTGKIENTERKFIPIRKSKFREYVEKLTFIEEFRITQYYEGDYKYRKFESDINKFTRSKKEKNYTVVEEIDENEFLKHFNQKSAIKKERKKYKDNIYTIEIDQFYEPVYMTMIEVSTDSGDLQNYKPEKSFIEVTNNPIYQNENIQNGSIKKSNIIIEGTDGVGKTTTITKLLEDGIICQDRCEDVISKNMMFDIDKYDRAKKIHEKYFSKQDETTIIFLINLDKKELERRIRKREKISEFDLRAYEYGLLYKQTYEYIIQNYETNGRLIMIDCSGLNIEEQYRKVRDIILNKK